MELPPGPPEDAYGRVTDSGRYQVVVDAALALFEGLAKSYRVTRTSGTSEAEFPEWRHGQRPTIRLDPEEGAPLVFMITDFPGVVIRVGEWGRLTFPVCGCDACDEQPAVLIHELRDRLEAVVQGKYEEELTKRSLRTVYGEQWSRRRLERGEWKQHGELGTRRWPPWVALSHG